MPPPSPGSRVFTGAGSGSSPKISTDSGCRASAPRCPHHREIGSDESLVLRKNVVHAHSPGSTTIRVRRSRWPSPHRLAACPHPCLSDHGECIGGGPPLPYAPEKRRSHFHLLQP